MLAKVFSPQQKPEGHSMRSQKKVISVCVRPDDLKQFDEYAVKIGMSRSELIGVLMLNVILDQPTRQELLSGRRE